jgi:hypothetical protein
MSGGVSDATAIDGKWLTEKKTALGFFVTLYAVLITLFGLAWVLFLIGMFHHMNLPRFDKVID